MKATQKLLELGTALSNILGCHHHRNDPVSRLWNDSSHEMDCMRSKS